MALFVSGGLPGSYAYEVRTFTINISTDIVLARQLAYLDYWSSSTLRCQGDLLPHSDVAPI